MFYVTFVDECFKIFFPIKTKNDRKLALDTTPFFNSLTINTPGLQHKNHKS